MITLAQEQIKVTELLMKLKADYFKSVTNITITYFVEYWN